jgi:hypothetical protein
VIEVSKYRARLFTIVRKDNRLRARIRIIRRHVIPTLMKWVVLTYYQRRAAIIRWRTARTVAKQDAEIRAAAASSFIDPNAKCPSCGACQGSIAFAPALGKVVHTCAIDRAMWVEDPIVKYADWKVEFGERLPEPLNLMAEFQRRQQTTTAVKPTETSKPN